VPSLGSTNIDATLENLVARATWRPGFVHPYPIPSVYKSLLFSVDKLWSELELLNIYRRCLFFRLCITKWTTEICRGQWNDWAIIVKERAVSCASIDGNNLLATCDGHCQQRLKTSYSLVSV